MWSCEQRFCLFNLLTLISVFILVIGKPNEDDKNVDQIGKQINTTTPTSKETGDDLSENESESDVLKDVGTKPEEPVTETETKFSEDEQKEVKLPEKESDEEANSGSEENTQTKEDELETPIKINVEPSSFPTEPTTKEDIEVSTSAPPMLVTVPNLEKEEAPENTYAVWNSKGRICLLAKFQGTFSIIYTSKDGEQKAEINVPVHGNSKGKCESTTRSPLLQISWEKYVLTLMFNKTEEEWAVTTMELTYDTSEPLFDGATNVGKKTARSKSLKLFETPLGKSYYCPAQEVILLFAANKQVITARIKEIYLQPYEIENGKFSPVHRCNKVVINGPDEGPFVQDETIPLAVGCTLALITLIILVGFSVHRAYNAAKVDYNSME